MSIRNIALAAGAAVLLPLTALAMGHAGAGPDESYGPMEGHGERGAFAFLHGVALTDTQRNQIHEIIHTSFAGHRAEMQQLHALHKQMGDLLASDAAVSEESLLSLHKQEAALREELDVARLNTMLQVRALLTPSQRTQMATTHQKLESLHAQEDAVVGHGMPEMGPVDR